MSTINEAKPDEAVHDNSQEAERLHADETFVDDNELSASDDELNTRLLSAGPRLSGAGLALSSHDIVASGVLEQQTAITLVRAEQSKLAAEAVKKDIEEYKLYTQEGAEAESEPKGEVDYRDPLAEAPQMKGALQKLGIPDDVARKIYSSWMTVSGAATVSLRSGKTPDEFTADDIERAVNLQTEALLTRLTAVQEFIKAYDAKELIEIHSIFHTANFQRYGPNQLHNQLARWHDNFSLVTDITALSYDDASICLETAGKDAFSRSEESRQFIFEWSSKAELAQIARQVGERERSFGRQPHIKNFLIDGHSNPEGIAAGIKVSSDGLIAFRGEHPVYETLTVRDYTEAEDSRDRLSSTGSMDIKPNTYRQHLGHYFRLILLACETTTEESDDEVDRIPSIAVSMRDGHEAEVIATHVRVNGVVIEPDGTVYFVEGRDVSGRKILRRGTVYSPDNDEWI